MWIKCSDFMINGNQFGKIGLKKLDTNERVKIIGSYKITPEHAEQDFDDYRIVLYECVDIAMARYLLNQLRDAMNSKVGCFDIVTAARDYVLKGAKNETEQ